jgi:glycosyltransferase involved in cell wall biosynthesis
MHSQIALSPVVVGIMAKTLLHKPFIITCHGSEVRLQKNYLIKIVQRIAFSIADYVTVVSHEMQSLLVSNYHVNSNKLDVIPNGYDPVLLENCPKNDDATCYITYVGRLSYPKDPMTLLLAFEKINKNVPNVNLQYVGEGQLSPLLKEFCSRRKLSRNVQFLGKLPHCKTIESIARSTVFVLSSFEEGLPTSLIEAMALRKPVVATSVGGVPEIVRNGVNGFLVPPKAPQQTADILIKLLRNPRIREELGVAAAESVQDYSWDKIARRYEKLYCKLLQKQKAC